MKDEQFVHVGQMLRPYLDTIDRKILLLRGTSSILEGVVSRALTEGFLTLGLRAHSILPIPVDPSLVSSYLHTILSQPYYQSLDILCIEMASGLSEIHNEICALIGELSGAIIVVDTVDSSKVEILKLVSFCREKRLAIIGILDSVIPVSNEKTPTGAYVAHAVGAPYLGEVQLIDAKEIDTMILPIAKFIFDGMECSRKHHE